ncbi:hypothetical protein Q5P01_001969 [Channa striata]|uniref:Cell growth-regulating nucleolar protein n=1 Tax=Channa striata TaxID=64152 RepID=A0AA88NRY2_CHASR|nr:hypothetical protein Q5P01_001969 [Channa striata]
MVFFTCNACGESLKKAQVDKHVAMCRGCQVLSCIDCGKDFWGNDYKNHIKCISEDQKYGGKGFEAKANKGDVKQQQWIQRINEAMNKPGISAKLKDVLRQVSTYDNVPRKKAKFQNWMRNSLKIANTSLHDEVWDILNAAENTKEDKSAAPEVRVDTNGTEKQNGQPEVQKKKLNKQERKEARQQKNGKASKRPEKAVVQESEETHEGKKKKKDRKRKGRCEEDENEEHNGHSAENQSSSKKTKVDETSEAVLHMSEETEDQVVSQGKFNWKWHIKTVLRESPDQELSVKKLRRKVLAAYYSFTGNGNFKTEAEVQALFNKKIQNNPKFTVLKERVRLVK